MDISYYWNGDRDGRRKFAQEHTNQMEKKYGKDIAYSEQKTKVYSPKDTLTFRMGDYPTIFRLEPYGSVDAIFEYAQGKTAVLNFASYKEPGGKFIDGSRAQEECLCAESNLYNILRRFPNYYEWNKDHKALAQYTNRALYIPMVVFTRENEDDMYCDVITCASPNITPARKYGWDVSEFVNSQNLASRIDFVLGIAAEQNVDTLILGAYGCGVFGQDATEVASDFISLLTGKYKGCFQSVIFAIPNDVHSDNYTKFKNVFDKFTSN